MNKAEGKVRDERFGELLNIKRTITEAVLQNGTFNDVPHHNTVNIQSNPLALSSLHRKLVLSRDVNPVGAPLFSDTV